jgi:DNA-binding MarR family transcriptional regulator
VDVPRFSPTIALLSLARAVEVDAARILEPVGLSVRKLQLLQRLLATPGATPGDLARTVGLTTDEVAPLLRAMVAAGLIKHARDGALSATPLGEQSVIRVDAALTELDARTFAGRDTLASELFDATQRTLGAPQD